MACRVRLLLMLSAALTASPAFAQSTWSGAAGIGSDNVFRGVSQTGGNPSLQANLRYATASGFYAAGWAATVDFGPGSPVDVELDGAVGYARQAGRLAYDIGVIRYHYPGARPAGSLDYDEWIATVTVDGRLALSAGWSDDVFATGRTGTYVRAEYTRPVAGALAARFALGEYRLSGPLRDYGHSELGLVWTRARWEARATWHRTTGTAHVDFGDAATDGRIEASVKILF